MEKEEKNHAAIIFTDMKGYSQLPEHILPVVQRINGEIRSTIIDRHSPIHVNTWGDAFFICLGNCEDAAEVALSIRDHIRKLKWQSLGFQRQPLFRIGIHFSIVTRMPADGSINVVGKGINTGSRIEPIADPGKIYCSDIFRINLESIDEEHRFTLYPIGVKKLAKDFGEMPLFELNWAYEQASTISDKLASPEITDPYIPRVPGKITDLDKRTFSDRTFQYIRYQFQKWAKEIPLKETSLYVNVREIDSTRLHIERYRNKELEKSMLIWTGGAFSQYGINTNEGIGIDPQNTNSYNEVLSQKEINGMLSWEATFGMFSYLGDIGFDVKAMDEKNVAEYLWRRFMH